jgi:hypothetical protein
MEGIVKGNKGFYENGRWRCAFKKIRWTLQKTMSYNSKSHLNITHFKEKVHMLNILL